MAMKKPAAAMKRPTAAMPAAAKERRTELTGATQDIACYTDSSDDVEPVAPKGEPHPAWAGGQGVDLGRGGPMSVNWARIAVRRLRDARLLGEGGKTLELRIWADCGGVGTAKLAGVELARALDTEHDTKASILLHTYCDKDPHAQRFVTQNLQPEHLSKSMEQRSFKTSQYYCDTCATNHEFPVGDIDVYVAGFRCTVWTRCGKRTGWSHPDVKPMKIGFRTIKTVQPALWLYEVPEGVDDCKRGSDESGLDEIQKYVSQLLAGAYHVQVARGIDPTWFGYPIRRPRVFMLGWRGDLCDPAFAGQPLEAILSQPIIRPCDFLTFFGERGKLDWSKVGEFPNEKDLQHLSELPTAACACCEDPMVICAIHHCACGACGPDGIKCKWRHHMIEFLNSRHAEPQSGNGRLTYTQVMALHGLPCPTSPRENNFLNVAARLPEAQPLNATWFVADVSQTVKCASLRHDGALPTLTTKSKMFALSLARFLTTAELSAAMAFSVRAYNFENCSEQWWRRRLGLSMHVSSLGAMLLALIAVPLGQGS